MSLRAILEITIHVESFRNIDLFHQGLYFLKFSFMHKPETKFVASPYHLHSCNIHKPKRSQKQEPHRIAPPSIDDATCSFSTRAFLIRYCEEEVEINDIAYFRIEIDVPDFKKASLFVETELMFSDLNGNVTVEEAINQIENKVEFKTVSKSEIRILNSAGGLHEYVPVIFDENHFCVANLIIESTLLDFRFRTLPDLNTLKPNKQKAENTLASFLFTDKRGNLKEYVGAEETDRVYNEYIGHLSYSYEKLRSYFIQFASKCLSMQERQHLGGTSIPPHINLPGQPSKGKNFLDSLNESSPIIIGDEHREEGPELSLSSISGGIEDERPRVVGRFSERMASHDPNRVATALIMELNLVAGQLFQLWHRVLEVVRSSPRTVVTLLQENYFEKLRDRWNESIIRSIQRTKDFTLTESQNIGESHDQLANQRRSDMVYRTIEPLSIDSPSQIPPPELHPILFEDILFRERNSEFSSNLPMSLINDTLDFWDNSFSSLKGLSGLPNLYRGVHLFVLVHGFQGNSFDMRLLKNNLSLLHPEALILCSNSNEENTEGDIAEMGVRLAQEVINFVSEWCPANSLGRISFIGHSMGGIIIRSALPYLEQYSNKMHMYMTFSTPHLGYMYNSSKLIDAGMWFLKKWRRSKCLQQLSMTDQRDSNKTFMYELSSKKGLGWFKHVVLVSSFQDQYAPFDSARMEISPRAATDPSRGGIYVEMATNLLSSLNTDTLYRLDINFRIPEKSIDTLIGRAAHIQFLENQIVMKMLILRYPEFFN
jgi:hypothetical protein